MRQVLTAEAIGLTPGQERLAYQAGTLGRELRAVLPWVDELTGLMVSGEFIRRRLRPRADYTRAARHARRGVWFTWLLECGPVYQARYRTGWGSAFQHRLLTVASDGELLDIHEEQAKEWLANVRSASTS